MNPTTWWVVLNMFFDVCNTSFEPSRESHHRWVVCNNWVQQKRIFSNSEGDIIAIQTMTFETIGLFRSIYYHTSALNFVLSQYKSNCLSDLTRWWRTESQQRLNRLMAAVIIEKSVSMQKQFILMQTSPCSNPWRNCWNKWTWAEKLSGATASHGKFDWLLGKKMNNLNCHGQILACPMQQQQQWHTSCIFTHGAKHITDTEKTKRHQLNEKQKLMLRNKRAMLKNKKEQQNPAN